jgi:4-amino-4-deoxy-L-arabinose transferase-like glycosyltransferase
VVALPMFYPWSALIPVAARAAWVRRKSSPAFGFLLGWVVGPWLVLECFQTKLIHYYLPSFPACALLVAWLVVEASRQGIAIREWPLGRLSLRLIGILAIGGLAALGAGAILLPGPLRGPSCAMAICLGVGTQVVRSWMIRGETSRAAQALVGTWAVVMGLFVAWFLPAAEPYRLSRVVGERLGELSARTNVRPAVMTYQEPGVIYALGHPTCDVRGYDEMFDEVRRNGPILVPLLPSEVIEIRGDSRFRMEVFGSLTGFNFNKGRVLSLEFAVVGAGASGLAGSGQQSLVK